MTEVLLVVQVLNAIILVLTLLTIRQYTFETSRLRAATEEQLRVSQMPVVRVRLIKGPDRIEVENLGGGPAVEASLRNFRFDENGDVWYCNFDPIYMLMEREGAVVHFDISSQDGSTSLDRAALFQVAFRRAFERLSEPVGQLLVQTRDIFGGCYRAVAMIDVTDFLLFRDSSYQRTEYRLRMGPPVRQKCEELPLLDRTRHDNTN